MKDKEKSLTSIEWKTKIEELLPASVILLGDVYDVRVLTVAEWEKEYNDTETVGAVDYYKKLISIRMTHDEDILAADCESDLGFICATFRHEVMHAMFHEAGLTEFAESEILVEALALILPKVEQYLLTPAKLTSKFDF